MSLGRQKQHAGGNSKERAGHRRHPSQRAGMRLCSHYSVAVGIDSSAYLLIVFAFGSTFLTRLDVSLDFGSLVLWKLVIEPGD